MKKEEFWKDIKGYEDIYIVSNKGRVSKILKETPDNNNYLKITLIKNKRKKTYRVHRLVAQNFIDNPKKLPMVNHKNENKIDNNVENLEYCDAKYNCNYGTRMQRIISKLNRPIIQYDLDGNFIKIWESIKEAEKTLKIRNISQVCIGIRNKAGGYIWKYKV